MDFVSVNVKKVLQEAKSGTRHGGVYKEAMKKNEKQLRKSFVNRRERVKEHEEYIANPKIKVPDWDSKPQAEKDWIIKTWEDHAQRNAEQATIEETVYKERFGNE